VPAASPPGTAGPPGAGLTRAGNEPPDHTDTHGDRPPMRPPAPAPGSPAAALAALIAACTAGATISPAAAAQDITRKTAACLRRAAGAAIRPRGPGKRS
jgi:hypothetical protein